MTVLMPFFAVSLVSFFSPLIPSSTALSGIVATAIAVHALRTLVFFVGARREQHKLQLIASASEHSKYHEHSEPLPFVSVIVPARNEEANVERCVRSLMASDYPSDRFECIIVNDRSSDRTSDILSGLQAEFSRLVIHNTIEESAENTHDTHLKGKTRALYQGIKRSVGEILLMTDADCTVQPTWIRGIVSIFTDDSVGLVASFTVIDDAKPFSRIQALEWVMTHTMASAGVGIGQPLGCFGNNLSVRRSVYDEIGGYERVGFSLTEDLALLQAVHRTSWNIRYVCANHLKVSTLPCETFGEFIKQHRRWVLGGRALGWRGAVFVSTSAVVWVGIFAALLAGRFDHLAAVIAARVLLDGLLGFPSLAELGMKRLAAWLPIGIFFFLMVEFILPFFLLKPSVEWKGQMLRS